MLKPFKHYILSGLLTLLIGSAASAQISYTGAAPYTQDFNDSTTFASSGTSSLTPPGITFVESGTAKNTTYTAGTGSIGTGDTYSFGTASAPTDRAFGEVTSGALSTVISISFVNNTAVTLNQFTLSYNGEQYRIGQTAARTIIEKLDFKYSVNNGTFVDPSGNAGDYIAPTGAVASSLNPPNVTPVSVTVTGLSVAPGGSIVLQFSSVDASGTDDGLAIDDLNFRALGTTSVDFMSSSTEKMDSGMQVKWKTGYEANNLGFWVYRQVKDAQGKWGPMVRLNSQMMPGNMFLNDSNFSSTGGFSYSWSDNKSKWPALLLNSGDPLKNVRYYIEDVGADGSKTLHRSMK